MPAWLVFSLVAAGLWGLWGVFGKIAVQGGRISAGNLVMLALVGYLLFVPVVASLFYKHLRFEWGRGEYYMGLLCGMTGSAGMVFFCKALASPDAEASKVVVVTAMYPAVTVLLAFLFLREEFSAAKMLGIALALAGVYLISK